MESPLAPSDTAYQRKQRAKLPAGFARLAGGFAIIFVGEAAASSAASAATARARPTARGLGARFVDLQIASAQFFSVETGNRFSGFVVVGHFDKSKAPRPAGLGDSNQG